MIINYLQRHLKPIAWSFWLLFYSEWLFAAGAGVKPEYRPLPCYRVSRSSGGVEDIQNIFSGLRITGSGEEGLVPTALQQRPHAEKKLFGGGPTQPEMQAFQSVNANNMVDLFSGDFSYNIPLMDVGGYPVNISYRSGISMDQEASWVGLGWNVNPGTITRNMRGLPDDFNGTDSIKKINSIHENKTIGVTGGGSGDVELAGFPINIGIGANLGIFHNNYKGWGLEYGVNASINAGGASTGELTGGLGLNLRNNTQDGLTITPSLSVQLAQENADQTSSLSSSFSTSLPYNSRSGLKGLELSAGERQGQTDTKNQKNYSSSGGISSQISFASTAYTPTIRMPLTNHQYTFTAKVGLANYIFHPSFYISGYVTRQSIEPADTLLALPAYGYLHYQDGVNNANALLDMNREKELLYRDNPPMPHIAVPIYTYDAYSITGEGTGGMFRAYRGDIGFIHDHLIRTKDASDRLSVDVGIAPQLVHAGLDLNVTRAFTQNGPWVEQNSMANIIQFKKDSALFEASYFRNPGEKSINSKKFYDAIGGDDVVAVKLYQPTVSSSLIQATNYLTHYRNATPVGDSLLTPQKAFKTERDKRTQVISYLTAQEADAAGLSKYIENYTPNLFSLTACPMAAAATDTGTGAGLTGEYFATRNFSGPYTLVAGDSINHSWARGAPSVTPPAPLTMFPSDNFSIRWIGRIQAPVTGTYTFSVIHDDGVQLWLNDSLLINKSVDGNNTNAAPGVNLVAGEFYTLKMDYDEHGGDATIKLQWAYPGQTSFQTVPKKYLFPLPSDMLPDTYLTREKRINSFRKANHISEIDVLNNDGRRYIYGIPVYNLRQKEATFAVNGNGGNRTTGLVNYANNIDNTAAGNRQGKDWYFNSEEIPAYAHSFLLTGILSPDYVDRTGNGISDDDQGDAVKFNYSKICGISNPYRWRAPYFDSAGLSYGSYNEGLKTDSRDDKANYVYGEKELWYLHSIESKTMIATFVVEDRTDLYAIDEAGHKHADNSAKRLKEIDLYSKADFLKNGTSAIPVKTVHFEYTYELCPGVNRPLTDSGKLTLKKIWFTYNGNDKGKQNPYLFNYNALNPSYNIKSYDRWGNYKDPLQNPGSTSANLIDNAEYPYALQDSAVASQNAAAWSLDSIYLPSGGAIKVAFESDDYAYVQNRRSMDLFKLAGLGIDSVPGHSSNRLYNPGGDNLYVFVTVPRAVTSKAALYQQYLAGVSKLYFKLFVRMPDDQYGSGSEYVSCYADLDQGNSFGLAGGNTIWIRISGISLAGDVPGTYSPLAKAAIQFLRLNLPSKAYPGSEVGDNLDLSTAVTMIFGLAGNIVTAFQSFDNTARSRRWCTDIDLNRSFIRLDNPYYKKYGGGHRVKKITIYDKWDKMVPGQRAAVYGQQYTYTTQQEIGGVMTTVSSGVASYEPGIGGEENPFRQPIEYIEKIAPLGPVTLGYSEEPLGESVFPSAGVGYSKVRVRTINYKNRKSANGYEETTFYTAYDFPTLTDRSLLDNDTKKRYKPALANLLRIDARNYLTLSQGFKVELNDMHGKLRSQAYYPETDPNNYTSYTENIYKVENPSSDVKKLSNVVPVMHPDGTIDTAGFIGKDVELMVDMREQLSVTNGYNLSPNTDMFAVPFIPPLFVIPSLINLAQREQDQYRSVAALKVIQRYGILDSVIHIDKGSKVSTKDVLYDSETGDVLLTRTQNEFNDPVYSFSYPSHWAYDGMGLAYKNIDLVLNNVYIKKGKIFGTPAADTVLFSGGDELLIAGRQQTGAEVSCVAPFATFPDYTRIWAVDSSALRGGAKCIYFIDQNGLPYNDSVSTLKVIRSGRRNMNSMVGTVTTLQNPLVVNPSTHQYSLVLNTSSGVLNASAAEFRQYWKVEDRRARRTAITCTTTTPSDCASDSTSCVCACLRKLFNYLIASKRLFIMRSSHVLVSSLVADANSAGYSLSTSDCSILSANAGKYFYATTSDTSGTTYSAKIGDCDVSLGAASTVPFYQLQNGHCDSTGTLHYSYIVSSVTQTCFQYEIDGTIPRCIGCEPNDDVLYYSYEYIDCDGVHQFVDGYYPTNPSQFNVVLATVCASFAGAGVSTSVNIAGASCGSYTNTTSVDVQMTVGSCTSCDTITDVTCYSLVTDTVFNPYVAGVLGNWRGDRNYTYFGPRAETDPSSITNIRRNGTFHDFAPFWSFQGNKLGAQYDSTRWVWNSELTMFNRKGLEIENKDPLGRYNAIQYGYNLTLPVAVTQNGHYREAAFEGFEDYGFLTQVCDTSCSANRHIDFSPYLSKLTTTQKHSGKSSLQLNAGEQAGLAFPLTGVDTAQAALTFATLFDACTGIGTVLNQIKIPNTILLPAFSPYKGQQMVVSAWVKEQQSCTCSSYTNNDIKVIFSGGSGSPSFTFLPTGNIIEGWQRFEGVFTIPADATIMSVNLEATGSTAVYFDDLRLHPFNANMKSFVYNPVNLRLMAEQDENNYSTFYEYDDDGTLIRVKKETERGIQTIKETRSALLKQ